MPSTHRSAGRPHCAYCANKSLFTQNIPNCLQRTLKCLKRWTKRRWLNEKRVLSWLERNAITSWTAATRTCSSPRLCQPCGVGALASRRKERRKSDARGAARRASRRCASPPAAADRWPRPPANGADLSFISMILTVHISPLFPPSPSPNWTRDRWNETPLPVTHTAVLSQNAANTFRRCQISYQKSHILE